MAENFEPTSPFFVTTEDGTPYVAVGWYSATGDWVCPQPMVENPDGPGIGPWGIYHGDDPFYVRTPETRGIQSDSLRP